MKLVRQFTGKDSVIDLVKEDHNILPILSRFGIPLGFQSKYIDEVCRENDIDTDVFLFIINFIMTGKIDSERLEKVSPAAIVDFLHNSHNYFLGYKFPHIRQNLLNALDECHNDINPAIISFFDSYLEEVKRHFKYEETKVFPHIKALMAGEKSNYSIHTFQRHHDEVGEKLSELKNIILRFYTTSMPNRMYDVLVDIYNAEEDLDTHKDIENHILIPLVTMIELQQQHNRDEAR